MLSFQIIGLIVQMVPQEKTVTPQSKITKEKSHQVVVCCPMIGSQRPSNVVTIITELART
jgi:hypothetical protein